MKGYLSMPKKVEIEKSLEQCKNELLALSNEHKQLQRTLTLVLHVVQLTKEDLDRNLQPVTLCDETGSEQVQRYEQGLKLATQRLSVLSQAVSSAQTLNFLDPLWQPTQGEDDQISAYLQ